MKKVKSFGEFVNESGEINEAASWGVDVEEPFDEKAEKAAMAKFKIQADPIVVVGASGFINDDESEVQVQFSNGDHIDYTWSSSPVRGYGGAEFGIQYKSGAYQQLLPIANDYLGSTGTLIGDLCLIYRDVVHTRKLKA